MINQIAGMIIVLGIAQGVIAMLVMNCIREAEQKILDAINRQKK